MQKLFLKSSLHLLFSLLSLGALTPLIFVAAVLCAYVMIVPLGFAKVTPTVYRSGYPASKSLDFINSLGLKSIVSLINRSEVRQDLRNFCESNNIELVCYDVGVNKEPFLAMNTEAVCNVMKHLDHSSNLPCLIFCTNGKLRSAASGGLECCIYCGRIGDLL